MPARLLTSCVSALLEFSIGSLESVYLLCICISGRLFLLPLASTGAYVVVVPHRPTLTYISYDLALPTIMEFQSSTSHISMFKNTNILLDGPVVLELSRYHHRPPVLASATVATPGRK